MNHCLVGFASGDVDLDDGEYDDDCDYVRCQMSDVDLNDGDSEYDDEI